MAASTKWALAIGCAITVANLYYVQPLLAVMASEFGVREAQIGTAATLAQVGYAIGMLTIIPLGDIQERRSLILLTVLATAVTAVIIAFSPNFTVLCAGFLLLGIASCTPQLLVPFAAALAKPGERGSVVGFVMSGLLLGILLARTASGLVGEHFGWRAVFFGAAALELLTGAALLFLLPKSRTPHAAMKYREALASLPALIREEPVLRESMWYGAFLFAAFSAFWTTLSFHLRTMGLGEQIAGYFGLVGAAGALAAPIAGKLADKGGPRKTILLSILLALLSFGIMAPGIVALLVVGVLLMDVGVQACQVTNQSRFYSLRPEARSRMNTVYMTAYFIGGSLGSALGSWAWAMMRWTGVCIVSAIFCLAALGVYFITARKPSSRVSGEKAGD